MFVVIRICLIVGVIGYLICFAFAGSLNYQLIIIWYIAALAYCYVMNTGLDITALESEFRCIFSILVMYDFIIDRSHSCLWI